ncbi:hypothetical protein [Clostridium uliginosum]|uniref:Phage protein, HK97 gp10 family n=1 Tax=Clostridium uliginosum TaxID=119641 RepID=A0A1I1H0Z4_9CLOT|nr:hypothetical protein [Clostridium uliginosum]SFC15073.1 hypothetical protein SAMN05421842_10162 [Clostridium uliginosum]
MSVEIKGINNLINRIGKLSNIESEKVVIEVAEDMAKVIKEKASTFSENSEEIKAFKPKKFGKSTYIDVGLKSSESDWDKIKGMYFNNYGYHPRGGATLVNEHIMWFDETVQGKENQVKTRLKAKLKEEVKKCWEG